MSYYWGRRSKQVLATVDPLLVRVFNVTISLGLMDIAAIEGVRDQQTQDAYFDAGKSKVRWPNSKHNILNPFDKARAIDAAPYVNGVSDNFHHCCYLAGMILAVATIENIPLRWGGNWDMDGEPVTDQDFQDLWHYELV